MPAGPCSVPAGCRPASRADERRARACLRLPSDALSSHLHSFSSLTQVARKFRRKDAKIIVACANGADYSIDVLEALEDEG